jgi:hypothetical protein
MSTTVFQEIKDGLRRLYLADPRPWLMGFSGGEACPERSDRDSTMPAALAFPSPIAVRGARAGI